MKKLLLVIASACMLVSSSFAETLFKTLKPLSPIKSKIEAPVDADASESENAIIFGYCKDLYTGLGTGQMLQTLKGAMCIPAATAAQFLGNKITKVRIGFGQSSNRNIKVFISKTLSGDPVYIQDAIIMTMNGWNDVVLDTPFEIDGSEFYVGYQITTRSASDYPIGVDGVPTSSKLGDNIAIGNDWDHIGTSYGSICIRVAISGDNLPQYDVALSDYDIPSVVKLNTPFDASYYFVNNGAATITETDFDFTINGNAVAPESVKLTPQAVRPGDTGMITLEGVKCSDEGFDIPVNFSLTRLNGESDVKISNNPIKTTISCAEMTYKKSFVVEEWTGNWCGFCPRGIVGMAYMEDKYADDGFIGIAVHSSSNMNGSEPMETTTYRPLLTRYADGFPGCIVNRTYTLDPNKDDLETYFKYLSSSPSLSQVNVSANYSDANPGQIEVNADVNFALSQDNISYRLAFVVAENGVGPYPQTNYFAGGSYGPMDGWENMSSRVNTVFDHVARDIFDFAGLPNSVPTSVVKNQPNNFSTTVSAAHVSNIENAYIVALLIDTKSGRIENAAQAYLGSESSISDIVADGTAEIKAVAGGIAINGDYDTCAVYGLDGRTVSAAAGESFVSLENGLYIVRLDTANGPVVKKIIVK